MLSENAPLCASFLSIPTEVEPALDEVVTRIHKAALDVNANWATKLKGHHVISLRAHSKINPAIQVQLAQTNSELRRVESL